MSGIPTAAELAEAVREWIEQAVMPDADGQLRFHARVAANALAIVERELRDGPAPAAAAALSFPDDRALAAAIRAGDLDDRYEQVARALRGVVRAALAIDDPAALEAGPRTT